MTEPDELEPEPERRRRMDRWLPLMLAVLAFLTAASVGANTVAFISNRDRAEQTRAATVGNRAALEAIRREGVKRRDQTCRIFEKQENAAVGQVRRTYAFLDQLTPDEARANRALIRAILRNLRALYRDAVASRAPPYCNAKGVGLPEPNPKLPPRRSFRHLK